MRDAPLRNAIAYHAPGAAALLSMLLIATVLATLYPIPPGSAFGASAFPDEGLDLPPPKEDRDLDSYADAVDLTDGDLLVWVNLTHLEMRSGDAKPYVVLGTQDDHARTGAGAELEWRHVVDYDALGRKPGSIAWQEQVLRTGTWVVTDPAEREDVALGEASRWSPTRHPEGSRWPQGLPVNVRDDRAVVAVDVELWNADPDPHSKAGAWQVGVDVVNRTFSVGGGGAIPLGHAAAVGTLAGGDARGGLRFTVQAAPDLDPATKQAVAERWAPALHFDSTEEFYPARGDALAQFHGFYKTRPNLRTWDLDFNNGRAAYRLLLADFDGNRKVDHSDAQLLTDVLRAGPVAAPTVYAHVAQVEGGGVVVQYWTLYFYNFVPDETGEDIRALAHNGDREFTQLRFANLTAALQGMPSAMSYSQHYGGIRVTGLTPGSPPFHDGMSPAIYVARGSHSSYPIPGDDRALRPAFAGFYDRFDGLGETWTPGNYTVEVLASQDWHFGHLWGPWTRHSRDLGTSARPLLQHAFRYSMQDPLFWEHMLQPVQADELEDLYGRLPE